MTHATQGSERDQAPAFGLPCPCVERVGGPSSHELMAFAALPTETPSAGLNVILSNDLIYIRRFTAPNKILEQWQ